MEITQHLLRRSAMSYASACGAERRHGERDVAHRLVLITCSGSFDRSTHRYADNLVVTAAPVD